MSRVTKVYCDVCGEEKEPQSIVGRFQWIETSFMKKNTQPKPNEEEYCQNCLDKIKRAIVKLRQECQENTKNK